MKKLFFLLLVTIILVACNGCEPINPPEPPPVKIKQFTITATVIGNNGTISPTSAIVDSGKSIILTITPSNGFVVDTFKVNNIPILLNSLSYIIYNVSSKQDIEVAFKKDSVMFPLLRIKWLQNRLLSFWNGKWTEWNLTVPEGFSFNPDGTYTETYNGTTSTGTWSLDRSVSPMILHISGFYPFTVETINEQTLSIYYAAYPGAIIYKLVFGNLGYKN